MTQLGIFEARQRRDEGMARAEEHADEGWCDEAFRVLVAYLKTHAEFFCDTFWAESGLARPHNSKAIGGIVRRAAHAKLMEQTGQCRPSAASNMSPKPVWKSLVYRSEG